MISLVILVSIATGIGYYYYNDIYRAPTAVESRGLMETNSSYEYLIGDAGIRLSEHDYEYKVLINPICGGYDSGKVVPGLKESDVALSVAGYVESLNTDDTLGIFLTRDTDTAPTFEQRYKFVDIVDPDIVIEIGVGSDNDTNVIGTSVYYDDAYYDYHLVNSELADMMERSIVTSIEGVAEGVFPLEEGDSEYIKRCHRPAVYIKCGYITNPKEAQALLSETYKSNIAKGILDAIDKARGKE